MGGMTSIRTLFILPHVCRLHVSVPPPPFASFQVSSGLFLLHLPPLNKPCARVKIKRKNRNNRPALITLIRRLCFISGELLFRSFEMHEAGSFSRCLLSVLWPFKDPASSWGATLSSYRLHLTLIASSYYWTYMFRVNWTSFMCWILSVCRCM